MDEASLRRRCALALGAGRMGTFEYDVNEAVERAEACVARLEPCETAACASLGVTADITEQR
ncbi:MAG: hypothetical protein M3211_04360 [Actinomycetota bacterium]|nr:hypothetical protein [Actinomycetota bacterium]